MANLILPGAAYTEKHGTYVNMEGRVQLTKKVVTPPGDAREDWTVLRALSEVAGAPLKYDNIEQVRARMAEISPSLAHVDELTGCPLSELALKQDKSGSSSAELELSPFERNMTNFYASNPIARASVTMAKCIAQKSPKTAYIKH